MRGLCSITAENQALETLNSYIANIKEPEHPIFHGKFIEAFTMYMDTDFYALVVETTEEYFALYWKSNIM